MVATSYWRIMVCGYGEGVVSAVREQECLGKGWRMLCAMV